MKQTKSLREATAEADLATQKATRFNWVLYVVLFLAVAMLAVILAQEVGKYGVVEGLDVAVLQPTIMVHNPDSVHELHPASTEEIEYSSLVEHRLLIRFDGQLPDRARAKVNAWVENGTRYTFRYFEVTQQDIEKGTVFGAMLNFPFQDEDDHWAVGLDITVVVDGRYRKLEPMLLAVGTVGLPQQEIEWQEFKMEQQTIQQELEYGRTDN